VKLHAGPLPERIEPASIAFTLILICLPRRKTEPFGRRSLEIKEYRVFLEIEK